MRAPLALVALGSCLALAACVDDADGPGEPLPVIEGRWHITRTVRTQPAGCRALAPGEIDATFQVDGTPAIAVEGSSLKEWNQSVTAETAAFVTEDYAFPEESFRPVLISHQLAWVNSQLLGTGGALGDGDDLHCEWTVELVGIFVP